jgi:hypothetical protein
MNFPGSLAFNAKFLHKHKTPKPTCTNELVIPRVSTNEYDIKFMPTLKVNSWLG